VLVAIVACVNPYWTLSVESWATKAVGIFLITFFCSAVLAGFALLFFTRGIGKNWVGNFVRSLWVIAAFVLFGQWGS
jgi:Na+/melibiose symporter-like transporter